MKLHDGIVQAYQRKWSSVNTFDVQIDLANGVESVVGGGFTDDINLNIITLNTPDFTNDPVEAYIGGRWYLQNGKDTLYRFTITFRDEDQMSLYRKFVKIYRFSKENYFDDSKMTVTVSKDADWGGEEDKVFAIYDGVMIEAVSNVAFDNNTENQIAEFTVSFKCVTASQANP